MASIPILRVETLGWPVAPGGLEERVAVVEYSQRTARLLRDPYLESERCTSWRMSVPAFSKRELGGLIDGPSVSGTSPSEFELLGESTIDGEETWVIHYAYNSPSDDSRVSSEDTEWIAKLDFRLVRLERDYKDTLGFVGQWVSIIDPIDAAVAECPATPEHSVQELTPLTTPRIAVK